MKRVVTFVFGIVMAVGLTQEARAACTQIDLPGVPGNGGYLDLTGKCSLGMSLFVDTSTCTSSDGTEGAAFVGPVNVRRIGMGWLTWSAPPDAEEPTPWVGFTNFASTLNINLAAPAMIGGVEVEPNQFDLFTVTADFNDVDGLPVATLSIDVAGASGAKLFAVQCDTESFSSIKITAPPLAQGFAIAQVRSDMIPPAVGASETSTVNQSPVLQGARSNAE